jgi:NADH:ubiquinone oxidoreductase subunit D
MTLQKKNLVKKVKNFTLNFGPQHPAAHGVLRLVIRIIWRNCYKSNSSYWFTTSWYRKIN